MKTKGLLFSLILILSVSCSEAGKQETVKTVKVVKPEPLGMIMDKQFSGVVKEAHEISVGFKTGGQIARDIIYPRAEVDVVRHPRRGYQVVDHQFGMSLQLHVRHRLPLKASQAVGA